MMAASNLGWVVKCENRDDDLETEAQRQERRAFLERCGRFRRGDTARDGDPTSRLQYPQRGARLDDRAVGPVAEVG
jgi:hypothetical protein